MYNKNNIPLVDQWKPEQNDIIFTNAKNIIMAPVSRFYHMDESNTNIDFFIVKPKKSYNSEELRQHTCLYLNYFEKFFDQELEYFTNLAHIKFFVDIYDEYNEDNLIYDLNRYMFQPSIFAKTRAMVEHNYSLTLSYKSAANPQLQYTNEHAKVMMQMSILVNMCIPIITHFAAARRIPDVDEFLLDIYDYIIYAAPFAHVDIFSKFNETTLSNVSKNEKSNIIVWGKQEIRGKDVITHSDGAVRNIILNILPKYSFEQNMVSLNYTSIQKSNKYQVTDIAYEYSYIPLSSSKRDGEDNTSEFDKYEQNLIRTDESLFLQSKVNCEFTLNKIIKQWCNFPDDEIDFYVMNLRNKNGEIINGFQKKLIFNLFYKYFGDSESINNINNYDYVKLMLIAKRLLKDNMMSIIPYVISAKVEKIVARKTLNKKEQQDMEQSPYYPLIVDKYKNEKIIEQILSTIATIITSNFSIIDYYDRELHGKPVPIDSHIVINEALLYVLLT